MPDQYALLGHPVHHSLSPHIHAEFARQTGENMHYQAIEVPLDGFAVRLAQFRDEGGQGANVTVPFKEEAFALAHRHTARAQQAGAVNTLVFSEQGIMGDNTDGVGLVRDITRQLGFALQGKRILLLGAGGAARGVIPPLLAEQPTTLMIANRSEQRAAALLTLFASASVLSVSRYEDLAGQSFDLVINATSVSLQQQAALPLPVGLFAPHSMAYEMMYGDAILQHSPFCVFARAQGAAMVVDGLGMLIEQAAEAFYVWRGVRPDSAALRRVLRPNFTYSNSK